MEFIGELVTRAAGSGAEWVAALDHEIFDDAVELDAVVVSAFGEVEEVGAGHGHLGCEEGGFDVTFAGVDDDSDVAHRSWESGGASLSGQARKRGRDEGHGEYESRWCGCRGSLVKV